MIRPSLEELQKLKDEQKYKSVPVSMEIISDIKTPMEVLKILKKISMDYNFIQNRY